MTLSSADERKIYMENKPTHDSVMITTTTHDSVMSGVAVAQVVHMGLAQRWTRRGLDNTSQETAPTALRRNLTVDTVFT